VESEAVREKVKTPEELADDLVADLFGPDHERWPYGLQRAVAELVRAEREGFAQRLAELASAARVRQERR
jgi:hypothetical protein